MILLCVFAKKGLIQSAICAVRWDLTITGELCRREIGMITLYTDKKDCFGCEACAAACRFGAITMKPDSEGFLYPVIDASRCTECGRCIEVCPAKARLPVREGKFYAVRCNDEKVLE